MEVVLAGFTVDSETIDKLKKKELPEDAAVTPETISAAYARISRYPQPVTELRRLTRTDVESARKSNRIIVFGMGHHSVAEHVQFNFDIMGVSRLALEALETARLCSYTEKSQRYITLEGDFVTPSEFPGEEKRILQGVVDRQVGLYKKSLEVLLEHQKKLHPDMLSKKRDVETIEGWAKEDARYALGLSTAAQLGFSGNARNIEYTIRKLRYHKLAEVRELAGKIFEAASAVAPSLIILSDPEKFEETFGQTVSDDRFRYYEDDLHASAEKVLVSGTKGDFGFPLHGDVRLVDHTPEPDVKLCAALLAASGPPVGYDDCLETSRKLRKENPERFKSFILDSMKRLCEFDPVPREFETISFTFEIVLSSSCFAQLKRHRMMTLLTQRYDPHLGITVPPSVEETKQAGALRETADLSAEAYVNVARRLPRAAEYLLTNSHRRRVVAVCNLRELYHIGRLRMDPHAQWDIRNVSESMTELARGVAPAGASLACGKHEFGEIRSRFFEGEKQASREDDCGLKYSEVPETQEEQ